jgi:hypothetical protein
LLIGVTIGALGDVMSKQALGAFERQSNGDWTCIKDTSISIVPGWPAVSVRKGMRFAPRTVFAGSDNFTAYLESVGVESPSVSPHRD